MKWHTVCTALQRGIDYSTEELGRGAASSLQCLHDADRKPHVPKKQDVIDLGRRGVQRRHDGFKDRFIQLLHRLGHDHGHTEKDRHLGPTESGVAWHGTETNMTAVRKTGDQTENRAMSPKQSGSALI